MKKIIFINSHPIQYFAPLYKYMNKAGLKTAAWYCSDETIKGSFDQEFGVNIKWDIPLLQGYDFKFFKNYSWKPSLYKGFFGLINFGMIGQLFREPKSVFIIHGWNYFSHFLVIIFGKLRGHTMCLRVETPLVHEQKKSGFKQKIKRFGLKYILFPFLDYYLYIGNQNRLFYESYGIKSERLIFCPYSVDNERFTNDYKRLNPLKANLRETIGIPNTSKVILYSGKYIDKKRPLDLLLAFIALNKPDSFLILVGEGNLREELEAIIEKHQVKNVILTGFVNQTKIAEYYAVSDVFVMCSTVGETWGLSVNEAMNFNLPVVLSDLTGSSHDVIKEGVNGYAFETGNIKEMAEKLEQVLYKESLSWAESSKEIIEKYSYNTIVEQLKNIAH
ncbi:glycosyltransferase family 4 protein [Aurantibacter sp.]|uniref:glycosyltransferase family 4 protein n=1 Tax=Aurantibacter sp. TaxID=2807103 RepID=UPI00326550CB